MSLAYHLHVLPATTKTVTTVATTAAAAAAAPSIRDNDYVSTPLDAFETARNHHLSIIFSLLLVNKRRNPLLVVF